MDSRRIVLDTETTGIFAKEGDRIIEIGCIEILNNTITNNKFHYYLNTNAEISPGAYKIHGISSEFLKDKPKFSEIVSEFLEFIGNSPLVIHNAEFDTEFINNELSLLKRPLLSNQIIDTILIAREKFPGAHASLDALCKRFNIDLSSRKTHGALLDAELLSLVYLELAIGTQTSLNFTKNNENLTNKIISKIQYRNFDISKEDFALHLKLRKKIKNSIWDKIEN